jgi:hypothetical protein
VVLPTIMPSTLRRRAIATTSSSWVSVRSGAILISTGVAPAFRLTRSRTSTTRAVSSSNTLPCWRSRRPGVLGDDMLQVK